MTSNCRGCLRSSISSIGANDGRADMSWKTGGVARLRMGVPANRGEQAGEGGRARGAERDGKPVWRARDGRIKPQRAGSMSLCVGLRVKPVWHALTSLLPQPLLTPDGESSVG